MLKLKLWYFGHLMRRTNSLEKTLILEKIEGGRRGDDRGRDGWMASPVWWAWVWVGSGSWWWTGKPGVLQSMGSQRVGHSCSTELTEYIWKVKVLVTHLCPAFCNLWPTRLLCPWNYPGKNPGVGNHYLLQGIFLTQGSKLGLPLCRQILYNLSYQGNLKNSTHELRELLPCWCFRCTSSRLLQHCVCVKVSQSCPTLCYLCSPPGSFLHGDSPGKNTGVSCHFLLQGIFPTQGSNPDLLHCRWILYWLSHQESPFSVTWSQLHLNVLVHDTIMNLMVTPIYLLCCEVNLLVGCDIVDQASINFQIVVLTKFLQRGKGIHGQNKY